MPQPLLTHFDRDNVLLGVFAEAMNPYCENKTSEWPENILSNRTVIYADGTIAREGDAVTFAVDPDELELCRRLANEAAKIMEGIYIPGSAGEGHYEPFYNTIQAGAAVPQRLDAELIRARFAGTIFAKAEIDVEPMSQETGWWKHLEDMYDIDPDGNVDEELQEDFNRFKEMVRWFRSQTEFVDTAYVRIGDNLEGEGPDSEDSDVDYYGVVMPRLVVGLTKAGSLAGLGGVTVKA